MLGKETAIIALFSLISFYENNSVFWLLWLFLIISFAFNKYLPEKYTNFKNNFNYINLSNIYDMGDVTLNCIDSGIDAS